MIQVNLAQSKLNPTLGMSDIRNDLRQLLPWIGGLLILIGSLSLVLNPNFKSKIRSVFMPPYRVVVSIAQADLAGNGQIHRVLKVKTHQGLYLEVYAAPDASRGGLQPLVASVKLPDTRDGFFTFNGEVTNLAIDDIDNDGKLEVLATSFDDDMVAHLSIYRFDPTSSTLARVTTEGNTVNPH